MVMPHNERVGRGLDAVRDGIKPICEAGMARPPTATAGSTRSMDGTGERRASRIPSDLIFLLKGMQNTWQEVWRQRLGQSERAYTSELRDFPEHSGRIRDSSPPTTRTGCSTPPSDCCQAFSAAEQLKILQGLKKRPAAADVRRAGSGGASQDGGEADRG
jgi:hypothetical protein